MNILVVGCGKAGAMLCTELSRQGHDVSVISDDADDFALLGDDFNGFTTTGVPIDQETLKHAGVESCDALVSLVTNDDSINIMVAQMAKQFYNVPKVIARIYDSQLEEIFSHMGFTTVCPSNLTVASLINELNSYEVAHNARFGTHITSFTVMDIPKEYIGCNVSDIVFEENESLYAIERADNTFILVGLHNEILLKGDKLIFSKLID